MKIAGKERRNKPNWIILQQMQKFATRGWVYRKEQGWIFAELTPDELAELRSYELGITIPRMRIRLPYDQPLRFYGRERRGITGEYSTFYFAYCTVPQADSLLLSRFQLHQITENDKASTRLPIEIGDYETWFWSDEVQACRDQGCRVTIHHGWGWREWGVPPEWKAPLQYKGRNVVQLPNQE